MKNAILVMVHLLARLAVLLGTGGTRAVLAENILSMANYHSSIGRHDRGVLHHRSEEAAEELPGIGLAFGGEDGQAARSTRGSRGTSSTSARLTSRDALTGGAYRSEPPKTSKTTTIQSSLRTGFGYLIGNSGRPPKTPPCERPPAISELTTFLEELRTVNADVARELTKSGSDMEGEPGIE